jgi:hypothetical protein
MRAPSCARARPARGRLFVAGLLAAAAAASSLSLAAAAEADPSSSGLKITLSAVLEAQDDLAGNGRRLLSYGGGGMGGHGGGMGGFSHGGGGGGGGGLSSSHGGASVGGGHGGGGGGNSFSGMSHSLGGSRPSMGGGNGGSSSFHGSSSTTTTGSLLSSSHGGGSAGAGLTRPSLGGGIGGGGGSGSSFNTGSFNHGFPSAWGTAPRPGFSSGASRPTPRPSVDGYGGGSSGLTRPSWSGSGSMSGSGGVYTHFMNNPANNMLRPEIGGGGSGSGFTRPNWGAGSTGGSVIINNNNHAGNHNPTTTTRPSFSWPQQQQQIRPPSVDRPPRLPDANPAFWQTYNNWGAWQGGCERYGYGTCYRTLLSFGDNRPSWSPYGSFWYGGYQQNRALWLQQSRPLFSYAWSNGLTSNLWPALLSSFAAASAGGNGGGVNSYAVSVAGQIADTGAPAAYAYGQAIANAEQGSDEWRALVDATAAIFCSSADSANAWSTAVGVAVNQDAKAGCQLLVEGYSKADKQCPGNKATVLQGVDRTTVGVLEKCGLVTAEEVAAGFAGAAKDGKVGQGSGGEVEADAASTGEEDSNYFGLPPAPAAPAAPAPSASTTVPSASGDPLADFLGDVFSGALGTTTVVSALG